MAARRDRVIPGGDCYHLAAELALASGWTLVHGTPTHPILKRKMGHAWVEHYDLVFDPSGNVAPKGLYYAVGEIDYTVKYTKEQLKELILDTEHWGPWDETVKKALHS